MELLGTRAVNTSGRFQRLTLSSLSGCPVIVSLHRSQGVFGPVSLPLMTGPFFICSRNRRVRRKPRADCIFGFGDPDAAGRREQLQADAVALGAIDLGQ